MRKRDDRYDTSGLEEAEHEPGSRGRVLKNLLGIKGKREMDRVEAEEQMRALEELVRTYDQDHRFVASDISHIHKVWLGRVYRWAGQYRQVNLSKDNFPFATSEQIPGLMADFEEGPLKKFTPCRPGTLDQVAEAPGSHQRGTDAYPPIPGREWTCRAAPHDPHGTPSRAASPILWDSGRTEATRVLSGSASGTWRAWWARGRGSRARRWATPARGAPKT